MTGEKRSSRIRTATKEAIKEAARVIRAGGLVAFPTETVYGLGADACDDRAVASVFSAKGRPSFNPLIVHLPDLEAVSRLVTVDERARLLADAFWPGPLTLVMRRVPGCPVSLLASAGLDTLAVRVPAHPVAQALLRETARPVVAPSANRSNAISPTTADHVLESLGDAVDLILDGGPCDVGVESTVLDLTGKEPLVLRPGGLERQALEELLGPVGAPASQADDAPKRSPGMLHRHYAPRAPIRIDVTSVDAQESLLAFGPHPLAGGARRLNLSETGDLREAAANLFRMMRQLDDERCRGIAVMPIPGEGLGEAINDRLQRAAASTEDEPPAA